MTTAGAARAGLTRKPTFGGQTVPLSPNKVVAECMLADKGSANERESVGLDVPEAKHARTPIKDHFEESRAHLKSKGCTARHVELVMGRLDAMAK